MDPYATIRDSDDEEDDRGAVLQNPAKIHQDISHDAAWARMLTLIFVILNIIAINIAMWESVLDKRIIVPMAIAILAGVFYLARTHQSAQRKDNAV